MQRVKELVQFGGFSDCNYLQRTLLKEFQQMEARYNSLSLALTYFRVLLLQRTHHGLFEATNTICIYVME